MALSYCSNWETFQQMDSDVAVADSKLRDLPEAWNCDCFFEANDFFLEKPNSLLNDFDSFEVPYNDLSSVAAERDPFLLQQELEPLPYPKRQKACEFEQVYSGYSQFNPTFFNGGASYKSQVPAPSLVSTRPCLLQDYPLPEITTLPPLPDFQSLPGYAAGSFDSSKKEQAVGSLSAQSIAARNRRRRITEKTQELGKLVPGGQKMNTAEMFQSAYKYIKYLQAQVGLLELLAPNNQENALFGSSSDEFQILLESPLIQEKLYSTENCLVPQKLLEKLRSEKEVL